MNALSTYLEKYSYDYILSEALKQVPDTVDKREGGRGTGISTNRSQRIHQGYFPGTG